MMNVKTFRLYIVLLISLLAPFLDSHARILGAEAQPSSPQGTPKGKGALGLYLSADVFGYIYPVFVKDAYYSSELSATLAIENRFFPTVEVGMGSADMVSQLYEIGYRTRAPYYRVGMDYNMQYEKDKPGYIFLGGRVGYTSFDYSVEAPPLRDPIWGDEAAVQFVDVPCRTLWVEAVGGVRAEIAKNFWMGWSLRYKYPLYQGKLSHGGPWYIPGFGKTSNTPFMFNYTIGYTFRTKKDK